MLNMIQPAFYVDLSVCTGCKTCMVACLDGHDLSPSQPWRRVYEYSGGKWTRLPNDCYAQNVFAYYVPVSCNHCQRPACTQVCPTGAMHKNANGIVCIAPDRCIGCRCCELNCPYSAPQYSPALGKMTKCDFCVDRLDAGLNPLCVDACPMRAIHFGEYSELQRKYGSPSHIAPLPDPTHTEPCLFFTHPRGAKPVNSTEGYIANPEEL